jgi:hypothetical protein
MKNNLLNIAIGCCLFFSCTASVFAQNIDTSSRCDKLRPWRGASPQTQSDYKQSFDSVRKYIELCANDPGSSHAFSTLSADCYYYAPDDTNRFDRFRDWCISVLYLNTTDPYYFCADLQSIMGTYGYGKWKIQNAALAIAEYLATNPYCNDDGLHTFINNTIRSRHDSWLTLYNDGDTSAKEDTTLPSLDSLGLGFLLKGSVTPSTGTLPSQYLASFTASENPFITETKLRFVLNRMAYITIDIFDELGRPVYGEGSGRTYDVGSHEITIDGNTIPSGTLYARISTGFGEVKTVKLVHEK